MFKSRSALIMATCIAGVACTAMLKYYPSFIFYNTGLLLVLLLTIFLKSDSYTYVFGAITILLILFSVQLAGHLGGDEIIKQTAEALITFIIIFLVLRIKNFYRSLDKEKKQLNALFDFAKESTILTNGEGEIIMGNREAQRLFGYDANEMAGKKLEMLIQEQYHSMLDQYRKNIRNPSLEQETGKEMFGIKKNGNAFPVEINLNSYEQKKDFFILTFIVDLSQSKEAENRFVEQKTQLEKITRDVRIMNIELENKVTERTLILQEALQELERSQTELNDALSKEKELNEIKSRFVSMASHEFRTPLSTILSSASLLQKYRRDEDQAHRDKHIRRIKDSVKHLNDMLEDFLNLGKIEEGRVFTEVVVFDVKEFLHDVFDEMKISLKMGQQLKFSFEGENFFATDKRLLKNVLINLLSNAIKFSDLHKTIEISVDNSSTFMILQVKDQGIGIAKEDLPHLFSTFYRGKNAVNIPGTGLGLHIVKRYVDMLEGSITLTTALNEGTTFNIGLPNLKELV